MAPKKIFYQLEVTLTECRFDVSRVLIVPEDIRLDHLHMVLQRVMGWLDSHMHEFQANGKRYGMKMIEDDNDVRDERRVRLSAIAKAKHPEFCYIYDFGDEWIHLVKVTDFDCKLAPPKRQIVCLSGTGSCPPEDCGGTVGYEDFCAAINDPKHPEHEDQLEWIFEDCHYPRTRKWPDGFDLEHTNLLLADFERWYRWETAPKSPAPRRVWMYTGGKK
ncbi:MAG: plasmid pRiA4b ORF-3 family protein [Lentisphaeria bacterium]|nr:plasmid pRiA4b ORF-3 family protein [Lentisphaeria bacterium]